MKTKILTLIGALFFITGCSTLAPEKPATPQRVAVAKAEAGLMCATAADVAALPAGHWCEVPDSRLDAHKPSPQPDGQFKNIMSAWNGAAFDQTRDRLLIWGGGHGDYAGNEIYGFSLQSLTWSRLSEPSLPPYGQTGDTYPDGKPRARHTYDHIQYLPAIDSLFGPHQCCHWPGSVQGREGKTVTFDFETGEWDMNASAKRPSNSGNMTGAPSAYDPNRGWYWVNTRFGGASLASYDPFENEWKLRQGNKDINYYKTADIDSERDRFVMVGNNGKAFYYDLADDNPTKTRITSTGNNALESVNAPGFVYDEKEDVFVGWNGGVNVYLLNPVNWGWQKVAPAAGNTTIPTQANEDGTYGRFRYSLQSNVFVVVNQVDENVYIYRLSEGAGTTPIDPPPDPDPDPQPDPDPVPSSDWESRSTAPGVLSAYRFDSEDEVTNWTHQDSKQGNVVWEQGNKASGNGSLRFNVLKTDGSNSGNWRRWLADDQREFGNGDEFYVSYRMWMPEYYATNVFNGGGWKQSIISRNAYEMNGVNQQCNNGATCGSNQLNEIVANNNYYRGLPQGYNRTTEGEYKGWHTPFNSACSSTDFRYQNAVDRGPQNVGDACENARAQYGGLYSYGGRTGDPDPLTGAFIYRAGEWMTFKFHIKIGTMGTNTKNSTIKLYAAREGGEWDLLIDNADRDLGNGPGINTLWLLPYDTGRSPNSSRQDTYVLYDEVIVSLNDIAAPGGVIDPPDDPVDPCDADPDLPGCQPDDPPDEPDPDQCPVIVCPDCPTCPPPVPCPAPEPCPDKDELRDILQNMKELHDKATRELKRMEQILNPR